MGGTRRDVSGFSLESGKAICKSGITNCWMVKAVSSVVLQQEILQSDIWLMSWPQSIGISVSAFALL